MSIGAAMGHAVHYRDAAGDTRLEDVPSFEAALELVERLRNEDGPSHVRLFREVPVEVRTYYKVVAVDADAAAGTDAPVGDEAASAPVTAPAAPTASGTPGGRDEPPPGAMPLAASPISVHHEPEADDADETAPAESRRPSLFSRG